MRIMMPTMKPASPQLKSLYVGARTYQGEHAYRDLLVPWLAEQGDLLADMLRPLGTHGEWMPYTGPALPVAELIARSDESAFQPRERTVHGLGRVADGLRLRLSPPVSGDGPQVGLVKGYRWPRISMDEYLAFFAAVGMHPVTPDAFDPVLCEIARVEHVADDAAPIELVEVLWPAMMLGEMVFHRAAVRVRAGSRNARAGVADSSPLYWAHLRSYRPVADVSAEHGPNGGWDVPFRRDYITPDRVYLNAGVRKPEDINQPAAGSDDPTDLLTMQQRFDLLLHRCLIRDLEDGQPGEWLTYTDFLVDDWTYSYDPEILMPARRHCG